MRTRDLKHKEQYGYLNAGTFKPTAEDLRIDRECKEIARRHREQRRDESRQPNAPRTLFCAHWSAFEAWAKA